MWYPLCRAPQARENFGFLKCLIRIPPYYVPIDNKGGILKGTGTTSAIKVPKSALKWSFSTIYRSLECKVLACFLLFHYDKSIFRKFCEHVFQTRDHFQAIALLKSEIASELRKLVNRQKKMYFFSGLLQMWCLSL